MSSVYAVILAGGSGTRFWPASRMSRPKQLLSLAGNEPLLRASIARISAHVPPERVLVATGAHLLEATAEVLPDVPRENLLAEPAPRNTAPCIAWATARIARTDPDAVVCVLPSDHHVTDQHAFSRIVGMAIDAARGDRIVTIGIVPTRAETGYGYVEVGDAIAQGVFAVRRFVEKPDRDRAEEYLSANADSIRYLWNAGMFFFRARVMMDAVCKYLPEVASGLARIEQAAKQGQEERVLAEVFPRLPSISIDYGIMEKASFIAVIPGSFGWSDLGSWQSAWELAEKDDDGNVLPPGAVSVGSARNLVSVMTKGKPRTWALAHVEDLVIVETDDAVLVIPRERAQDVRAVVEILKARGGHLL
jgi:mannose-1-phosphate guanylyltransferase